MADDQQARLPVTIYSTSPMGSIGKIEGFLTEVNASGTGGAVSFIPKRGRRVQVIMTYYSPFIMVVEGWNKPDPESGFLPSEPGSQPGVSVSRGRYRGTDPRWVSDFMTGPGKSLHPIVLFEGGRLVKNTTNLARTAGFKNVLRLAAEMPAGSEERRNILQAVAGQRAKAAGGFPRGFDMTENPIASMGRVPGFGKVSDAKLVTKDQRFSLVPTNTLEKPQLAQILSIGPNDNVALLDKHGIALQVGSVSSMKLNLKSTNHWPWTEARASAAGQWEPNMAKAGGVAAETRWDFSHTSTADLERMLADVKRHQIRGEGENKSAYLRAISKELQEREHSRSAGLNPSYANLLTDLVQHIDGMEDGQKKHADKARHIVGILKKLVTKDPGFGGPDSNARYGGHQVLEDMAEALDAYSTASNALGHTYDELNSWMSRNGPKG